MSWRAGNMVFKGSGLFLGGSALSQWQGQDESGANAGRTAHFDAAMMALADDEV